MKEEEKRQLIIRRAKELAQSGTYGSYLEVRHAAERELGGDAWHVLGNDRLRQELMEMCEAAQAKKGSNDA